MWVCLGIYLINDIQGVTKPLLGRLLSTGKMGHPGALACSKTLNKPSTCFLQRHLSYSYPCRRILCRHIHIEDFTTPPTIKVSFEDLLISRFTPLFLEAQRQLEREQGLRLSRASWLSCTVSCGGGNGGTVHFQHRLRMLSSKKSPLADWDLQILWILGRGSTILSFWSFPVLGTCSSHFGYQVLTVWSSGLHPYAPFFYGGPSLEFPNQIAVCHCRVFWSHAILRMEAGFSKKVAEELYSKCDQDRDDHFAAERCPGPKWMGSGWGPGNFRI